MNPRQIQRLKEFPCSICGKEFEYIKKESVTLNGFKDADTNELVHLNCKEGHYKRKDSTEFKGKVKEFPLTMDDIEELAIEKEFSKE